MTRPRADIPILFDYFIKLFGEDMNQKIPSITDRAMELLKAYDWPGNVRELQNVIQRMLFIAKEELDENCVRQLIGMPVENIDESVKLFNEQKLIPWREMERQVRRACFQFIREHTSSEAEAARKLGLAPPNYFRMCKELGLK